MPTFLLAAFSALKAIVQWQRRQASICLVYQHRLVCFYAVASLFKTQYAAQQESRPLLRRSPTRGADVLGVAHPLADLRGREPALRLAGLRCAGVGVDEPAAELA